MNKVKKKQVIEAVYKDKRRMPGEIFEQRNQRKEQRDPDQAINAEDQINPLADE